MSDITKTPNSHKGKGEPMVFAKIALYVSKVAQPIAKFLNFLAGMVLVCMMLFTSIDVVARYFFHSPILGSFEIISFMLPAVVAFGFSTCFLHEGHVCVDLLISMLSEKKQTVLQTISYLIALILFIILTIATLQRGLLLHTTGKTSEVLYWPYYPFVFVVFAGWASVVLVLLQKFCENIAKAVRL